MPTLCKDCDHVEPTSRKAHPWRWLCTRHKRGEGFGFVTDEAWDKFPPYLYCADVNGGFCPLYAPLRDGQIQLIEEAA